MKIHNKYRQRERRSILKWICVQKKPPGDVVSHIVFLTHFSLSARVHTWVMLCNHRNEDVKTVNPTRYRGRLSQLSEDKRRHLSIHLGHTAALPQDLVKTSSSLLESDVWHVWHDVVMYDIPRGSCRECYTGETQKTFSQKKTPASSSLQQLLFIEVSLDSQPVLPTDCI